MSHKRIFIMMYSFLLIAGILLGKLSYCQLIKGQEIARQAVAMRSRPIELKEYKRGEILDRNRLPITTPGGVTAVTQRNASGALFSNNTPEPSLGVIKRYREDGFMAHILGYCSGGQSQEGISGLEKRYDKILSQNTASQELTSVLDARGIAIQGLMFKLRNEQERYRGALVLTIDKRIQEIVEQTMNEQIKTGAVVVMDVNSKEVLAIASRPTFNPYAVSRIITAPEPSPYVAETSPAVIDSSLNNRALMAYYPGSIFKILVAAAALEEQLVHPEEQFHCDGSYVFNDEVSIPCFREKGHGSINFAQAFAHSCNTTFIEIGLRLKRSALLNYAEQLHLTDENLLGYGNYKAASHITIENADPAVGNACLGQEGVMLTPLQICNMVATVADNGRYAPPVLVQYTIDREGTKQTLKRPTKKQVISPKTAQILQQLMQKVVTEGTGKPASLLEVSVAGKTATSQTGNYDQEGNEILNTWFTGFFPADNPRWAIVVLNEGGKSGSEDAAPVFKSIARQILR